MIRFTPRKRGSNWSAVNVAQAPSYRRTATYWIVSAKRAETRERRLGILIADSAAGRRLDRLSPGRRAAS